MHDLITQLLSHARGMWRYRWLSLLVSWAICLIGWPVVYALPNVYEASTRVFVDTDSVLRPLLRGLATETNVMSQVKLMTRALLSRPHLEEVARETDLDLRAATPQEMERLIEDLQAEIEIRASADQLYTITYRDRDPRMAHAVVQTLLANFVGDTLQTNRSDSEVAMRFLNEQIAEHEARLVEAEERLAAFKKENVSVMPDKTGDYYSRLQAASAELEQLQVDLDLAQRTRRELRRQIAEEEPVLRVDSVTAEYDAKIAAIEDNLGSLALSYTDKHPDIIAARETLERLRQQRDAALATAPSPTSTDPMDLNPVYQTMKIELNSTEVEIARLQMQIQRRKTDVAELRRSVDTIPVVEAELAKLNRDYEVTKTRYEALLERLESASLTKDAEQSNEDVKFRVLDPPTVPLEPVAPNRLAFLAVTMLFALGAGGIFAYTMNQVNPVFVGRDSLREVTNTPVIGTVSVILTPGQRLGRTVQLGMFLSGVSLLLLVFALAVAFRAPAVALLAKLSARVAA